MPFPWTLPVRRSDLTLANPWYEVLRASLSLTQTEAHTQSERFWFKNDEKDFARELLSRRPKHWLFRCDQRRACGDFVVVDMSSPRPAGRLAFVVDLKQGADLKQGGGGAGAQLLNASRAVEDVADRYQVLASGASFSLLTGDRRLLLAFLGA
jgi:hypothetical protein